MLSYETISDTRQHVNGRINESTRQLKTKAWSSEEVEVIIRGSKKGL